MSEQTIRRYIVCRASTAEEERLKDAILLLLSLIETGNEKTLTEALNLLEYNKEDEGPF